MPVNPLFNSRSGANKFMGLAKTMCRLVQLSAPAIRGRYPDRPALLAVLTAAEGVCELLPAAMSEQVAMDNPGVPFDIADGDTIPGQAIAGG